MARNQERKQENKIIASTSTSTLTTTRATSKRERISENHKHQSERNTQSSNRSGRSQFELQSRCSQSKSHSKNNTEVEKILDFAQTDNSTKTSPLLANKLFRIRSKSGISQPFWPLLLLILLSIQLVNGLPSPSASNRHHSHLSKLVNGNGRDRRDQVSFIVDGRWNGIDQQQEEDGEPISNAKGKEKAQEEEMMQDLDSSRAPNQLIESDGIAGNSTQSSSSGGERPTRRWGHSSSFLDGTISNDKSQLLFIGGQVDKRGQITNDVWSLDLSDLASSSNSTSTSNSSSSSSNQWTRLSSSNLPPTAFSSSVLLPSSNNGEDQVWLIGGLTMDCMKDSPVYVWKNSTGWSSPQKIQESPMRRKGAVALTVPRHLGQKSSSKGNGTLEMDGVMVLGGISDESTCYQPSNSSSSKNPKQVNYFGLDIWSQSSKSSSSKSNISPSSRSLSLDSRMKTLSLVDSSTVLIPNHQNTSSESPSHDPRVAFMGGKTLSGKLAPLDHFWVLELNSGNWERWVSISKDPSGIPIGRIGHSTTMTSSGKIVMFGGYLNETDKVPTNELWVLDTKKNPAEWQKLESDGKPRAFHSADMINDVMVIGFGDDGMESMKRDDDVGGDDHLSFLDTQDQDPKNWKWSKDAKGVMDARSSRASTSAQSASMVSNSQSSPPESSNESSITPASNSNGNEASNQQGESLSGNQVGAAASESSTNSPSTSSPPPNDQATASTPDSNPQTAPASAQQGTDSPSSSSPESNNSGNSLKTSPPASNSGDEDESSGSQSGSSKKSGAIAGSVLGAAALLGTMGGLYAYKKRKDSLYESSSTPFDSSDPRFGFVDGGKKHNFEPVSNLWLTTPVAWASKGLKRRASETSSLGNSISGLLFGKSDSKGRRGSSTSNDSSNSTTETLWEKDDIYTVPSQPPRVAVVTTNNLGKSSDSKGMNVFRKISTSNKINALKNKRRSISSSLIGRNGRSPIEDSEAQLNGLNSFNDRRVSQGFISSIIHGDDEERTISPTEYVSPDLPRPMRSGFFNQQRKNSFPSPPIAAAMLSHQHQPERILRAPSCESLGGASSDGSASHCSYPFLSAMHRPSLANLTGVSSSASEASISRENVNESESETSPREKLLRKMVKEMRSEVDAENNHHHSSGTDLENGRNQILNPFSTPQEEDEDEMLASNSDDEEGIRSHLREESKLHQAHKRAMELNHLKSPSNQTDFDSDDEEIVTRNKKSIVNTPQQQRSTNNFQTPIFSWEPIRSPKVSMNGPYPTSTPTTGNNNRGKRLGAALLFSAGNKTLLKSSTADLSPRDPILSPDAQVFEDSNGTPLSIAAERAELLILMDNKDSLEQRKKSQKRARKSLLRVTNES